MKPSYIGVTGFMLAYEVRSVLKAFPLYAPRKVMVGVLASLKTLNGQKNKHPNRYPEVRRIKDIFIPHPLALNLIHYNSKELDSLLDQLLQMTELSGPYLHGFQLNIPWPSLQVLQDYRKQHPKKQIVLQIGNHAFYMIGHSPEKTAARVMEYAGLIDYVLFDASGGDGRALDPIWISQYLKVLSEKIPDINLVIAGGLGPNTPHLLEPFLKDYPNLSIDAEKNIRDENDNLNIIRTIQYLLKSLRMFMNASISDEDVRGMSEAQRSEELLKLRKSIREHRDALGDDRCWLDDIALYKTLSDNAPIITNLPPEEIFLENCRQFWKTRQCPEKETKLHEW